MNEKSFDIQNIPLYNDGEGGDSMIDYQIGSKVCFFQSLESTNTFMKENIKSYQNGDMICARVQTAGKGRRSNVWMSNDGDLHVSFLIDNAVMEHSLFEVILITTNTLLNVLKKYDLEPKVKYPNDIIVNGKKISGILVERIIGERDTFIVGFGLNVVTEDFSRINKPGTSIYLETNNRYDYRDVLFEFIGEYNKLAECKSCDLYQDYLDHSVVLHQKVVIDSKEYTVMDINLEGKLVLDKDGEEILMHMNEVSLKEFYDE